jgi:hypothetical protein
MSTVATTKHANQVKSNQSASIMSDPVIKLAEKIEALINEHPDAEEAETACSIAKELAGLRARRSARPISVNHSLHVESPYNRHPADRSPA